MIYGKRVSYAMMKSWAFECYYEGCRDHAIKKGWGHDEVMGYVIYNFQDSFTLPMEVFMWKIVIIILSGGWNKEFHMRNIESLARFMDENPIDEILKDVPEDEFKNFMHDLKILNIENIQP